MLKLVYNLFKINWSKDYHDPALSSTWPGDTIRVWFDTSNPEWELAREGFLKWEPVMRECGRTIVEVGSIREAQIVAGTLFLYTHPGSENKAGYAHSENVEGSDRVRRQSVISMNTGRYYGLNRKQKIAVWAHEAGHSLGIDNHAENKRYIMNATTYATEVHLGDIKTMRKVYGK